MNKLELDIIKRQIMNKNMIMPKNEDLKLN